MRAPPVRQTGSLLALSVLGMATLGPLGWPPTRGSQNATPLPDPIAIQRIQIPAERLPIELKRLETGVLVKMPRSEFEAKVQQAARAADAARKPPRLVEARYSARLDGSALSGTGEWKILGSEPGPSVLSLQSLGLALSHVRMQSGQEAIANAIVGDVDGKRPGLLLDHGGAHSVLFDWSARGEGANRGLRFDLQVPPAVVGSLELKLAASPPTQVETASPALVSGPLRSEMPDWQTWHIRFNNQPQVRLVIRQGSSAERAPSLVRAALQSRLEATADAIRAEYQYQIQASGEGVRELMFLGSAELQPLEVDAPDLETWETGAAEKPGDPIQIAVRMRKPLRGGLVTIRCQSLLPLGARWSLPTLQIPGSIDRGESIQLRLMSDLRLGDWQGGAYRIVAASTEPSGFEVLKLERSGPATTGLARPSARVSHRGPEVRARIATWWQIASPISALTSQIKYDVARGKIFELPLAIPAGWQVEQVNVIPSELLRGWNTDRETGQTRLTVELQRGFGSSEGSGTTSATAQLLVKLRPESTRTPSLQDAEFPVVAPLGATLQESVLGISIGSPLDATVTTRAPPDRNDEKGPWGRQTPSYRFREIGGPVQGILKLRQRSTRLRARCATEVVMVSDRAHVQARVMMQPGGRSPDSVIVAWSAPTGGVREWRVRRGNNRIIGVARLQAVEAALELGAFAMRYTLNAVALGASRAQPPELYRVSFAQPVKEALTLDASCEVAADAPRSGDSGRRWRLPLVAVLGSDSDDGELELGLPDGFDVESKASGLRRLPEKPSGGPLPCRRYQYPVPAPVVTIRSDTTDVDARQDGLVDDACLRSSVRPGSALIHNYRFTLGRWSRKTLPVRLPAGAEFVSAYMDGREISDAGYIRGADGVARLALPAPSGPSKHEFAIVYTTSLPTWHAWVHIVPPPRSSSTAPPWAPDLPIPPLNYRHLWSFPSGVEPIEVNSPRRLVAMRKENPLESLPSWVRRGLYLETAATDEPANRSVLTTGQLVDIVHERLARPPQPGDVRLGALLRDVATDPRLSPGHVVIDNRALADAGINPNTVLPRRANDERAPSPRDGWDQLHLAVVALDSTFLVTTTKAMAAWRESNGASMSTELAEAIRVAGALGSDASGRYYHLANWLSDVGSSPVAGNGAQAIKMAPRFADFDRAEWEAETTDSEAPFTLVNDHAPNMVGIGLAALTLLASWVVRGSGKWPRLLALGFWLVVTGLGLLWLPHALRASAMWPALAAGLVAVTWYAATTARGRRVRIAKPSTITAGLLVFFGTVALVGRAAAPGAAIVWLVGNEDPSGVRHVLVAPELLQRLDAIRRGSTTLAPRAVIIQGEYHGTVRAGQAEFQAEFRVYSPTDDPLDATIPLSGVQLKEAFCDGAVAHPRHSAGALPGVPEAYVVETRGRGVHTVRLGFAVAISSKGYVRDLKFAVPELVANRLIFEGPGAARHLEVVAHRGMSRITQASDGPRLEVELGRVSYMHLRWFDESGANQAATPRVREGYLWELRSAGSVLTAVLQYSGVHKPIPELEIEIPEGLELANVGLARLPGDDTEEASPRLRNWYMSNAGQGRRLHLELEHPLISGVQVILEMVPRAPFAATTVLPVPLPVGGLSPDGPGHESFLAYRTTGLDARVDGNGHFGVTGIAPAPFIDFWRSARLGDPGPDLQVYSFRRFGRGNSPYLRLRFRAPHDSTVCVQDIEWKLRRDRVECALTAHWSAPTECLVVLEWDTPRNLNVTDVSGAEVRDWSLTGSRLQVWLDHAVRSATVTVTGSTTLPRQVAEAARGSTVSSKITIAAIHAVSTAHTTTFVRIVPSAQLDAEPAQLRNLWPLPSSKPLASELAYVTDRSDHAAVFLVRPNAPHFDVNSLTLVEVVDRSAHFRTLVDCLVRQDQLRTLTVRVKNWDSTDVHLEGVGEPIHAEAVHERNEHVWKLDLPQGVSKSLRLQVSGSQAVRGGGSLAMPVVEVSGANHVQQWVAIAGPELQGDDVRGLEPVATPARTLAAWPAEAERIRRTGVSWAARSPDWHMSAVLRNRAATPGLVHIALCEQSIANAGSRRWLHQTTYWLFHDAGTDLIVRLPAQARLRTATVDGIDVPFASVPAASCWIRLASTAAVQRVHLTWNYKDGAEAFPRPRLDVPRPNNGSSLSPPTLWTFAVPPDFEMPRLPSGKSAMPLGQRFLRLAEAQLRLSALAADHLSAGSEAFKSALAATQQRFFHYFHLASLCGDPHAEIEEALNDLKDRNRRTALAKGYAEIRAKAEETSQDYGSWPASENMHIQTDTAFALGGTPVSWESGESADDPSAYISLEAEAARRERWSWLASLILIASVLGVWLIAASRGAVMLLQKLWPEQALILALLFWSLFGGNVVTAFFAVMGFIGRLLITLAWLRGKLRAHAPQATPTGS